MVAARTPAAAALVAAHEAATADRTRGALTFRPRRREPGAIERDIDDLALSAARLAETLGAGDVAARLHRSMPAAAVVWRCDDAGSANAAVVVIRELAPRRHAERAVPPARRRVVRQVGARAVPAHGLVTREAFETRRRIAALVREARGRLRAGEGAP